MVPISGPSLLSSPDVVDAASAGEDTSEGAAAACNIGTGGWAVLIFRGDLGDTIKLAVEAVDGVLIVVVVVIAGDKGNVVPSSEMARRCLPNVAAVDKSMLSVAASKFRSKDSRGGEEENSIEADGGEVDVMFFVSEPC